MIFKNFLIITLFCYIPVIATATNSADTCLQKKINAQKSQHNSSKNHLFKRAYIRYLPSLNKPTEAQLNYTGVGKPAYYMTRCGETYQ